MTLFFFFLSRTPKTVPGHGGSGGLNAAFKTVGSLEVSQSVNRGRFDGNRDPRGDDSPPGWLQVG